jgi:hypothetical protein
MIWLVKMAVPVAPAQARWRRFCLAETDASDHASAAGYRGGKNVGIASLRSQ